MTKKILEDKPPVFKTLEGLSSFNDDPVYAGFEIGERVKWKAGNKNLPVENRGIFRQASAKGLSIIRMTSINNRSATMWTEVPTEILEKIPDDDYGSESLYIQ